MRAAKLISGAMLCVTSAFLYAANHLAAVIYSQEVSSWDTQLGKVGQAYESVGRGLQGAAVVFLIVGIIFISMSLTEQQTSVADSTTQHGG